jgi:hypothetical protein
MAKHKEKEDPRIEDFAYSKAKPSANRRSITLWLDGDIIVSCKPKPAKKLREWIEANYWQK